MGTLFFKNGSKAYVGDRECTIISLKSLSEVVVKYYDTGTMDGVDIMKLSTTAPEKKEKKYIDTYSDEEWAEAKKKYEAIKDLLFRQKTEKEVSEVAKANNVSRATIYNWLEKYENTSELTSLISNAKQRGKKGSRLDPKVEDIIEATLSVIYLNKQRYSFNKIYRHIRNECVKLDRKPPHTNTIRNRINEIDPKLATKKRYGHKASQDKYDNFDGEYPEGLYPLDVVQIDHTPVDIILVDNLHRKPIGRPYLTLAIDVYSRMVAGFYLSFQAPGFYNVSQCMYNMLVNKESFLEEQGVEGNWNVFGIPRVIHVDNGADLVSEDMQRVCDDLSITLLKRPVARPQFGPHVERFFSTINKEVHNLPGTTFSNIKEKGIYDSEKEASMTLNEFQKWLTHYFVNIYHKKPHQGLLGLTPERQYEIGIFGDENTAGTGILPPITDDIEQIKIALLPTYYRTIQKDGIAIEGIKYYSDVLRHWIGITDKNNKKIKHKVKYNPANIQKIYFYDSELKEYFEVPYRKISAPAMTLWDLYAAKRYLKNKNIDQYTEDELFQAFEVLDSITDLSINEHKKQKLRTSKPPKMSATKQQKAETPKYEQHDNDLSSLFEEITIYDISDRSRDDRD